MSKDVTGYLTREFVETGQLEEVLRGYADSGYIAYTPPDIRHRRRRALMDRLPDGEDMWLFAYGSLIWNPMIDYAERLPVTLHGYHRRFCLKTRIGRASPECPGLVLALDRGGCCHGIAYRVARDIADRELGLIWNREMVTDVYDARIVDLRTESRRFPALAFIVNRETKHYVGKLPLAEQIDLIATAEGELGFARDYLFETQDRLADMGLGDSYLDRLASGVRKKLAV